MNRQAKHGIRRKLKYLEIGKTCVNVTLTRRKFGNSRETFYQWKRAY